jgi:pimeloyl-ACP methyl ester carboxylesterase
MPSFDHQGGRLFYERSGQGIPPLLFVHGFACDRTDWQPQVQFFTPGHEVVTCDLRGHGASEAGSAPPTIATLGGDVSALLAELALPPAVLVGHSMGCRVVLQAYLDAPHRVAGLVLVDGSRLAVGDPDTAARGTRQRLEATGYQSMARKLFADMFVAGSDPEVSERIVQRALALPEEVAVPLFCSLVGWDARYLDTALARVAVPLLVIQSTYINPEQVRVSMQPHDTTPWLDLIRQRVPEARLEVIGGVGHFTMLDAPEVVNRSIATFCDSLRHT